LEARRICGPGSSASFLYWPFFIFGHLVDVEWYTQAITFAWYVTIAIALRVIALKVFYLLIDLND
jgi:hypothetical protein